MSMIGLAVAFALVVIVGLWFRGYIATKRLERAHDAWMERHSAREAEEARMDSRFPH
jgi:hypothetical protein